MIEKECGVLASQLCRKCGKVLNCASDFYTAGGQMCSRCGNYNCRESDFK